MKTLVARLVSDALASNPGLARAAAELDVAASIERTRDATHGDFASNVAMRLAKPARKNPRALARFLFATVVGIRVMGKARADLAMLQDIADSALACLERA